MSRPLNMHDYETVLLLGGPEHNRMMTVLRGAPTIHVRENTGPAEDDHFWASDSEEPPVTTLAFRTVVYERRYVQIDYRWEIPVYVDTRITDRAELDGLLGVIPQHYIDVRVRG